MYMTSIGFFTPTVYSNNLQISIKQSLQQKVDDYFYLGGGSKAQVVKLNQGDQPAFDAVLIRPQYTDFEASRLGNFVKIVSYFTVIIPVIMLIAKAILRMGCQYNFVEFRAITTSWNNETAPREIPSDHRARPTVIMNTIGQRKLVVLEDLGLPLNETSINVTFRPGGLNLKYDNLEGLPVFTMKEAIQDVVQVINEYAMEMISKHKFGKLGENKPKSSLSIDYRCVTLNDHGLLIGYNGCGDDRNNWLKRIVSALNSRGYTTVPEQNHGYLCPHVVIKDSAWE